MAPIRFAFRDN